MNANNRKLLGFVLLVSMPVTSYATDVDLPGEGSFFRGMLGPELEKDHGITVSGMIDATWSRNNHSSSDERNDGLSNAPVVGAADEGLELAGIFLFIDKPLASTMRPRITPLPGPTRTEPDWGFTYTASYGRNAQYSRTYGWDMHWDVNEPGASDPAKAKRDKQQFVSMPNFAALGYLPVGTGINVMAGIFGPAIGYEIPPNLRAARNPFATKTYAFTTNPGTVAGVMLGTRAMNNEYGLLGVELGVVQGYVNLRDNNNSKSAIGALRWRSPDMKTWLDYEFIAGNEENESRSDVQYPGSRVISPDSQFKQQHSLNGWKQFDEYWSMGAELTYGEQAGDGKATTVDVLSGPGFDGAHWWGANAVLTYQYQRNLSFSLRAEHFSDPQGFALPCAAKGDMNAVTTGLRYDFNRNVSLRPELRYDWFDPDTDSQPFSSGRHLNQFTTTVQLLVYF